MSEKQGSNKFDFRFQIKILALLVQNGDFLDRYGTIILPEYFTDIYHQELCSIITKYWDKYNSSPSLEALLEEIERHKDKEKQGRIAEALDDAIQEDISDAAYYTDQTVRFCQRQATILAMKSAASDIKEDNFDSVLPMIEKAMAVGQEISDKSFGIKYWEEFDKEEMVKRMPCIPTMLGEAGSGGMDDVLQGGLDQGNVGMVMIPVGRGKSVFLMNVGGNAVLQNYNVLFISLELHERTITKRFNSFFSGRPSKELEELPGPAVREKVTAHYRNWKMGKLLIKTFPRKSITPRGIEAFIKNLRKKQGWTPDMLCIDYADLLKPPVRNKEKWESLADISDEIKSLAQKLEIPIWTASQINRHGAGKKLSKNEDTAGSYDKLFPIDVIFTSNPTADQETEQRFATMFCSKNRQGKDQQILNFELDFDAMKFVYKSRDTTSQNATSAYQKFLQARVRKE